MVSITDNWVRIFDIPGTSRHKNGFTIYKVVSMLYPSNCPDAVTKITVWKRYNDFKKLHKAMKLLHKSLCITDALPNLQNTSFFRRFDDEVIERRRQSALNFLEFLGQHFQLFTSREFIKFFEISHVPGNEMDGNINSIKAELNLPADPEYVSFLTPNSEDDTSDTDSISTLSSLSTPFQVVDFFSDLNRNCNLTKTSKTVESDSMDNRKHQGLLDHEAQNSLDSHIYSSPPPTPSSLGDTEIKYEKEALIHADMAMEFEKNGNHEDAFSSYKRSIDILLKNVKGDKDVDRRTSVRYKIEKYLLRAEKIYNMYLSPEMRSFHELTQVERECTVDRHISDLYKHKVVKIIGSGMLTLHSDLEQLYFVKVVRKMVTFSIKDLILPENVPYMVKLYNFYNCENALFLILHYCRGVSLWEYIKRNFFSKIPSLQDLDQELEASLESKSYDISDNDSEFSYIDLINDYANSKTKTDSSQDCKDSSPQGADEFFSPSTEDNFEAVNLRQVNKPEWKFEKWSSTSGTLVPKKHVVKWAAQLLLALEKLHSLGVICCDLHCGNLMVDDNGDLVLTYMCSIKEVSEIYINRRFLHLAPEIYSFKKITKAVDWWSYGTILYELLVGMPLSKIHPEGLSNYTILKIPRYVTAEAKSLLRQLLASEPHERLGCESSGVENLKHHPFFSTVSWDTLLLKHKNQTT